MLRKFRADKNYLAKYHVFVGGLLFLLNVTIAFIQTPELQTSLWYLPCLVLISSPQVTTVLLGFTYALAVSVFGGQFESIYVLGVPFAILLTFPVTGLLHCASHNSIQPKWLNRPVGEVMGFFQLYGFPDWKVLHFMHHSFSDDPDLDPHPPLEKKYWEFTKEMRTTASSAFSKHYFKQFGQTPATIRSAKLFGRATKFDALMKLTFWYLALGGQAFTFFYLTSIAFKMLHYAWFNHSTHQSADGRRVELRNLNHGLFYPIINALAFGMYFHKNHHISPSTFNPQDIERLRQMLKKDLGNKDVA